MSYQGRHVRHTAIERLMIRIVDKIETLHDAVREWGTRVDAMYR